MGWPIAVTLSLTVAPLSVPARATAEVDPYVQEVRTSPTAAANGDFYRIIVRNTEIDQCLTLETVNIRKGPRVVSSKRLCQFSDGGTTHVLDESQDVGFHNVRWDNVTLYFDLEYVAAAPTAPMSDYRCSVLANEGKPLVRCSRK